MACSTNILPLKKIFFSNARVYELSKFSATPRAITIYNAIENGLLHLSSLKNR